MGKGYRYQGQVDISHQIDGPGTDPVGETPNGVYEYGVSEGKPVRHERGTSVDGSVHFNPGTPSAEVYLFQLTTRDPLADAVVRLAKERALQEPEITARYPEIHSNSDPTRVALQTVFSRHYGIGCTFDDTNRKSGYKVPAWTAETH